MKRRDFISTAIAGATGLLAQSSPVLAEEPSAKKCPAPSKKSSLGKAA